MNGKLNSSTVTLTALDAPKRLAFDAEDSNSVFHHEFLFSPSGDGTLVERRVSMTKGPFYFPLVLHDLQIDRAEELQRGDAEPQGEDENSGS